MLLQPGEPGRHLSPQVFAERSKKAGRVPGWTKLCNALRSTEVKTLNLRAVCMESRAATQLAQALTTGTLRGHLQHLDLGDNPNLGSKARKGIFNAMVGTTVETLVIEFDEGAVSLERSAKTLSMPDFALGSSDAAALGSWLTHCKEFVEEVDRAISGLGPPASDS